jgi:DNA-directed RNA polymerase specialized sigma24 family protein
MVNAYRLPTDFRRDLTQEAFLELWRKRAAYDPSRGGERTFAERVIANRMTSVVRSMHSARSGQFREDSLDDVPGLTAPNDADLRLDVWCVLARASHFDRRVAVYLIEHSPTETSQGLGVSRAAVYRAIGRLRVAFTGAGFGNRRSGANTVCRPNCDMRIGVRQQEVRQ